MKTEDLPYTPADLEQATRLVDSPRFKEFLGPIRNFVVGKASDLKDQGDESVRVYRIAAPELQAYLGVVAYVLLFGKDGDYHYKSVSFAMSDDGFGSIKHSEKWGIKTVPDFNFVPLWTDDNMDRADDVLSRAIASAEHPQDMELMKISGLGHSLEEMHARLIGVEGLSESTYRDEHGERTDITHTLIQRLF